MEAEVPETIRLALTRHYFLNDKQTLNISYRCIQSREIYRSLSTFFA